MWERSKASNIWLCLWPAVCPARTGVPSDAVPMSCPTPFQSPGAAPQDAEGRWMASWEGTEVEGTGGWPPGRKVCAQAGMPSDTGYTPLLSFNKSLSPLGKSTQVCSIPGWEAGVLWDLYLLEAGMGVLEGARASLGPLREDIFVSGHRATWVTISQRWGSRTLVSLIPPRTSVGMQDGMSFWLNSVKRLEPT